MTDTHYGTAQMYEMYSKAQIQLTICFGNLQKGLYLENDDLERAIQIYLFCMSEDLATVIHKGIMNIRRPTEITKHFYFIN